MSSLVAASAAADDDTARIWAQGVMSRFLSGLLHRSTTPRVRADSAWRARRPAPLAGLHPPERHDRASVIVGQDRLLNLGETLLERLSPSLANGLPMLNESLMMALPVLEELRDIEYDFWFILITSV